jgi:isopentenyl diphosphate isomerase/L-lactate dehydrogenase-like FMN-dependent dehydrogenase
MTDVDKAVSFSDLHALAKRRLPRLLFDVIESGVEDELVLARNVEMLARLAFVPRFLLDVQRCSQSVSVFGKTYSSPVGIAPTGLAGVFRPGAESMLARAAKAEDVPFILSGACVEQLENVAKIDATRTWYQLYAARDTRISYDLMRRAADCGIGTLVLTVDAPVYPKRERDMRNGFGLPARPRPLVALEALLHPAWILSYLASGGLPKFETWAPYAPAGADAAGVFAHFRTQSPSVQTWRELDDFRRRWAGRLVVKGIQHPDDASRAADVGVDGVIVSNHGGKALDHGISAIEALPGVVAAVGRRIVVMFDSGVRRGADVAIAKCLGAQISFAGRAPLYGVIAGGEAGARKAIAILCDELQRTLALVGCPDFGSLDTSFLASS